MRLLDAEGLTGISMRAPAAEMNVTAMPVYWYVDTKHYLLELALDAALGEPSGPSPGPTRNGAGNCERWPTSSAPCWSATPGSRLQG